MHCFHCNRGYDFIWKEKASEDFGVSMTFLDGNSTNRPSGSGIEFNTMRSFRNPKEWVIDVQEGPSLTFDIDVIFNEPVDLFAFTDLKNWLCNTANFGKLQICAEYFEDYYFEAKFNFNNSHIYNGGYAGLSCTIQCNTPWATSKEYEYDLPVDLVDSTEYDFFNYSEAIIVKPVIEFQNGIAGGFSITNNTTGTTTSFSELRASENIIIDNEYGFIKSSIPGQNRIPNFNKQFFNLAPGLNKLTISNNLLKLKFRYSNVKRIGGELY